MTKKQFNSTGTGVGFQIYQWVGWVKGDSGKWCDWLIMMRIKGIQVQQIDPINLPWPFWFDTHYSPMANMQHPIIRPPVFGEHSHHPIIQLTTGWLLGDIQHWDNREHTPSLGYGHYPSTFKVIPLFIPACRKCWGKFIDHPRHLPWNLEDRRRWGHCSQQVVVRCVPQPLLWQLTLGPYDLRGWMAPTDRSDQNQWSSSSISALDRGPWLESSQ